MELISIVIPAYNSAPYVADAIRSGLEQSYSAKEVIVIDDGSTDGTVEVLKSFGDAIRWESVPNRGAPRARNRGVAIARGNWIQFLDADDWLHRNKLELQFRLAVNEKNLLVFCDGEYSEPGLRHPHHQRNDDLMDPICYLLRGGLPTPGPLHRKHWVEAVGGFRESLPCSQERDFHLRLAATGLRFQRLPEILYTVRRVAGSLSSSSQKVLRQHLPIAMNLKQILESERELTASRSRALATFLAKDARALSRLGDHASAKEYWQAALGFSREGVNDAFGKWSRWLVRCLGPVKADRLLQMSQGR